MHCEGDSAESFHTLIGRAQDCLARLTERREQFIALFGHGLFTRAVLWWLLVQPQEIDTSQMQRFYAFVRGLRIPNGAIVPLRHAHDGFWIGQMLTRHLAGIEERSFDE